MPTDTAWTITHMDDLRSLIGKPAAIMEKRLLTRLDGHCLKIIEHSALLAIGHFAATGEIQLFSLRGSALRVIDAQRLELCLPAEYAASFPKELSKPTFCSLLFIMPGIGFNLRLNGHAQIHTGVGSRDTGEEHLLQLHLQVAFLHCSRAMARADFWQPKAATTEMLQESGTGLSAAATTFIQHAPYLLLLSRDSVGQTDLSPRGDPAGFVLVLNPTTLFMAERPGNKVASSLSNILEDGRLVLLFVVPGTDRLLQIQGRAYLNRDPERLRATAVQGKTAKLGLLIEVESFWLHDSAQLAEAQLWNKRRHVEETSIPSFAKMLAEHMNGPGLLGRITKPLVDRAVRHDLNNLY